MVCSKPYDLGPKGKPSGWIHNKSKVKLVRYAYDFIVTAAKKEKTAEAKEVIRDFGGIRGLELSEEKTLITHIDDGFDMLGWTFRKYNGKLIIKPSQKAIKAFKGSLSETVLRTGKAWEQGVLIKMPNQQLRGWANYHRSVCDAETLSKIDHALFGLLWRWVKRRHPKKVRGWVAHKYWHQKGSRHWVFSDWETDLWSLSYVPIVRHAKVRMKFLTTAV